MGPDRTRFFLLLKRPSSGDVVVFCLIGLGVGTSFITVTKRKEAKPMQIRTTFLTHLEICWWSNTWSWTYLTTFHNQLFNNQSLKSFYISENPLLHVYYYQHNIWYLCEICQYTLLAPFVSSFNGLTLTVNQMSKNFKHQIWPWRRTVFVQSLPRRHQHHIPRLWSSFLLERRSSDNPYSRDLFPWRERQCHKWM